jgi:hypothetical protein
MPARMQKIWIRWEKTGDGAVEDVASRASLNFREARSMVESSCEGEVPPLTGLLAGLLTGDVDACFEGGGVDEASRLRGE